MTPSRAVADNEAAAHVARLAATASGGDAERASGGFAAATLEIDGAYGPLESDPT